MSETKTAWYFIVNPRAGSGKAMSEWVPAEQMLVQEGIPFVTATTDHKNHAVALAHDAAAEGYRKIAAVGGDGSLHEVLGGICSWCAETGTSPEEFYLAVVPIGSGNDWIKSCHVPNDATSVVKLIIGNSFGWMDIVRAVSRDGKTNYVANCAGVGFDSHVCERVNRQKEQGKRARLIYLKALRYTLFHLKPIKIVVWADGSAVFAGEAYSLAIGNGPWSGGGMRQVPLATNDDGQVDYMVVPKARLLRHRALQIAENHPAGRSVRRYHRVRRRGRRTAPAGPGGHRVPDSRSERLRFAGRSRRMTTTAGPSRGGP